MAKVLPFFCGCEMLNSLNNKLTSLLSRYFIPHLKFSYVSYVCVYRGSTKFLLLLNLAALSLLFAHFFENGSSTVWVLRTKFNLEPNSRRRRWRKQPFCYSSLHFYLGEAQRDEASARLDGWQILTSWGRAIAQWQRVCSGCSRLIELLVQCSVSPDRVGERL